MKIAKPLLLTVTPIGVLGGLHEAWRLVGGLTFLIVVMLGVLGFAVASVVMVIRREQRALGEQP
jgi:uncharacterized membrane protein